MQKEPLILTLRTDAKSQAFFDQMRLRYFPPERNFLKAHLTLFHHLPDVRSYLKDLQQAPFVITVSGLMNLGGGVAYLLDSEALLHLHRKLKHEFDPYLIPQDRQGFRPHIVIQNKVLPDEAKNLLAKLQLDFKPFEIQATGLNLWAYLGGPWRHEQFYSFG